MQIATAEVTPCTMLTGKSNVFENTTLNCLKVLGSIDNSTIASMSTSV